MDPQTPPLTSPPVEPQAVPTQPTPTEDKRQQIASSIESGKNVLVTVSANPSVDELASALGLTFLLSKLGKHVTAVFSGKIPSAMEFLDPDKTFENTIDSLRDFIIALDKDKADKLRYKVEDDVVKVFITPYRTVISEKDLSFSQGDFNVDIVIALGVLEKDELDKAILNHGGILHDASVIALNAGDKSSNLGSIDWHDPEASSISEMLVGLTDIVGPANLDSQISTAFLTGIVAETNRFSNDKTNSKVMGVAAQLMAAGANQQLIATNLRQEGMISQPVRDKKDDQPHDDDGEMVLDHETEAEKTEPSKDAKKENTDAKKPSTPPKNKDVSKKLEVPSTPADDLKKTLDQAATTESADSPKPTSTALDTSAEDTVGAAEDSKEATKEKEPPKVDTLPVIEPLPSLSDTVEPIETPKSSPPPIMPESSDHQVLQKPDFVSPINATTDEAEASNKKEQETAAKNLPTLSHDQKKPDDGAFEDDLDDARKAVEEAAKSEPASPEPPQTVPDAPPASSPVDDANPMDAFMTPQHKPNTLTDAFQVDPNPIPVAPVSTPLPATSPPASASAPADLPPLPPLPTTDGAGMPPLPPLPTSQPQPADPSANVQFQTTPDFMQNMPSSQNTWSQAGDDVAARQAEKDAKRQAREQEMTNQFEQAQDRQRELQGLPPLNDPKGSGLPPVAPPQT